MAKAINWPIRFRDEVLSEGVDKEYCAFRIGTLYYDNQYWVPDEVVDIRVNHLKVRKAVVTRSVEKRRVSELTDEDFNAQKPGLKSQEEVMAFLSENYDQPVTPETELSIVYYKNLPVVPEEVEQPDDPHM